MIKKCNIVPVNLSDYAINCLQTLGYLNLLKKSTGKKNLSQFVSQLITEFVGVRFPDDRKAIEHRMLRFDLVELQNQRDELEEKMQFLANKMLSLKEMNRKV